MLKREAAERFNQWQREVEPMMDGWRRCDRWAFRWIGVNEVECRERSEPTLFAVPEVTPTENQGIAPETTAKRAPVVGRAGRSSDVSSE